MSEPIARGRIKVDARKALDKLRDHMLVDPHLWACEIARVAVALGATKLDVAWTSSDFVLEFDGRALPIAQVAHARNHVLTPLDGTDGDALRSLGIGIGAALGLEPAFIEVTCAEGDKAQRVRFERNYLDEKAETEAPTPAEADPLGAVTTRVLVRRKLGLGSITRAFANEVPPEAALVEQHVDRTRIALSIRGEEEPKPAPPLLTVDLDVPGATRAVLEILDPKLARPEAAVLFYEHGVLLTSFEAKPWGLLGLPVRYVVDAPRLPTNASRSQMRSDAELTKRVVDRVLPAFTIAIAAMRGETTFGHDVKLLAKPEAIANAFGAIVAEVVLAVQTQTLPEAARALVDAPVVYDAVGRLVPLTALRGGTHDAALRVYVGPEPMPKELAPWLDGVLWRRGLAAERAVANLVTVPADDMILPAKKALERRARAMQHAASPPVVTPTDATIHRESFKVEQGPFAGLHGEIAVVTGSRGISPSVAMPHGRLAKARVFVDERALEEFPLPGVRLPVEIALAWPDHIVARFQYDAVERNEHLARALHVALRLAAITIATHLPGSDAELVRLAIATWADATRTINDGATLGALSASPVWRTTDERLVSLNAIQAYANATGAVCFAKAQMAAADGRIVVARPDVDTLRAILPGATFIAYDEFLGVQRGLPETPSSVAVVIQKGALEGFITPGKNRIRVYHGGQRIKSDVYAPKLGMVDVVLVDKAAVPRPSDLSAIWSTPIPDLAAEEEALLERAVQAVEQDAVEYSVLEDYMRQALAALPKGELRSRVMQLPIDQANKRRQRMRGGVLARAPFDLEARIGSALRGTARNKQGAVAVVLRPSGDLPDAELMFEGHPLGGITRWTYPLDVYVDVVDENLVTEDWAKLSESGLTWADGCVIDAALDLLRKLSERDDFADTVTALNLLAKLQNESPARAGTIVTSMKWPTVQGRFTKLDDEVKVRVGSHRYDTWQTYGDPSPFDAPALHLPTTPQGDARKRVLAAAGISFENVTEQVARLQSLRSKNQRTPPPKLKGDPAHPLLRASLFELGATLVQGELELLDADWSQVLQVNEAGIEEPVSMALSFPIKVLCRPDGPWTLEIEREIQRAAWQHLRNLLSKSDELPLFARRQLRRMVLSDAASVDSSARVFQTTTGGWISLADIKALVGLPQFTSGLPPFPRVDDTVLCLDSAEAAALSKVRPLSNVTEKLKKIQRGFERRNAPPREAAVLDDAQRAKCLFVIAVDEEGIKGELGFLHPQHEASRGLELLCELRPLCTLNDPEGWPILAVLNDDALVPDAGFEALGDAKKDQPRIQGLVRRLVGPAVNAWLKAPTPTLGVIRLPTPFTMRGIKGPKRTPAAIGIFWLPKEWPERPSIEVEGTGISQNDGLPTIAPTPGAQSRIVPVCGKLWVSAGAGDLGAAIEHVMAWVALRLIPHIRSADARHVERYRWDLALLGALDEPGTDPLKELKSDRPDPALVFVAARRAPHLIDQAVGDVPTTAKLPMNVQDAIIVEEVAVPADATAPIEQVPSPLEVPHEGFFAGLVRRVIELVTPPPATTQDTPLTIALCEALKGMSLTGDPVARVRVRASGRAVVYNRELREIIVNPKHVLVRAAEKQRTGVLMLAVTALSEINRELAEVTDAEETSKLLSLLRANEADFEP